MPAGWRKRCGKGDGGDAKASGGSQVAPVRSDHGGEAVAKTRGGVRRSLVKLFGRSGERSASSAGVEGSVAVASESGRPQIGVPSRPPPPPPASLKSAHGRGNKPASRPADLPPPLPSSHGRRDQIGSCSVTQTPASSGLPPHPALSIKTKSKSHSNPFVEPSPPPAAELKARLGRSANPVPSPSTRPPPPLATLKGRLTHAAHTPAPASKEPPRPPPASRKPHTAAARSALSPPGQTGGVSAGAGEGRVAELRARLKLDLTR